MEESLLNFNIEKMDIYNLIHELRYSNSIYKPNSATYNIVSLTCDSHFRRHSRTASGSGIDHTYQYGGLEIKFPYYKMGKVDSVNASSLFELFLFNFYINNPFKYKKTLDLGANLGLHSLIMGKVGMNVNCYEPDPRVYEKLTNNIHRNMLDQQVNCINRAVTRDGGQVEFVRVLDNLTGSHVSGFKDSFGPKEKIHVLSDSFRSLFRSFDFCKLDVEGAEADLILSTVSSDWDNTDVFAELDGTRNDEVFSHLSCHGVNIYSQKNCFYQVTASDQLPITYREGNVFITKKNFSDIRCFF